jgi:hypothetical protein
LPGHVRKAADPFGDDNQKIAAAISFCGPLVFSFD